MVDHNAVFIGVVPGADTDDSDIYDATRGLREGLLELDEVQRVDPIQETEIPAGQKSAAADILGWLAVNVGNLGLGTLVRTVAAVARQRRCGIEITINGDVLRITGASSEQQARIIDAWLARHA